MPRTQMHNYPIRFILEKQKTQSQKISPNFQKNQIKVHKLCTNPSYPPLSLPNATYIQKKKKLIN